MLNKKIDELYRQGLKILDDAKAESQRLEELKANLVDAIATAEDRKRQAIANNNMDEYLTIDKTVDASQRQLNYYNNKIEMLVNGALLSDQDYHQAIQAIYDEVDAVEDLVKSRLIELSEAMEKQALLISDTCKEANEALRLYQDSIMKDFPKTRYDRKEIKKPNTYAWGKTGIESWQYRKATGRRTLEKDYNQK